MPRSPYLHKVLRLSLPAPPLQTPPQTADFLSAVLLLRGACGLDVLFQLPFTYETKLSGIEDERRHDHIWYAKKISVDGSRLEKENFVIHFEGSDF